MDDTQRYAAFFKCKVVLALLLTYLLIFSSLIEIMSDWGPAINGGNNVSRGSVRNGFFNPTRTSALRKNISGDAFKARPRTVSYRRSSSAPDGSNNASTEAPARNGTFQITPSYPVRNSSSHHHLKAPNRTHSYGGDAAGFKNVSTNVTSTVPPRGFPWHRWTTPSINHTTIIQLLEYVEKCVAHNLRDIEECASSTDRHVFPFVVQQGKIWRSKAKYDAAQGDRRKPGSRLSNFERILLLAMRIARNNSHLDERIANVVRSEFPVFLFKNDRYEGSKPLFTWSQSSNEEGFPGAFPIPSYYLWDRSKANAAEWEESFQQWSRMFPWSEKRRMAIWRGSTTGHTPSTWEELPRVKLARYGATHPSKIDAALTTVTPRFSSSENDIKNSVSFADRIPQDDFMKYIAIIDIDGNSWSSRFGTLLCYNSVVIKVQPQDIDYFFDELEPWTHYLPVHANLSNLVEVVDYAIADENRDAIQKIVHNANQWCKQKLTYKQLATDLMWIVSSYLDLLQTSGNNNEWNRAWQAHKNTRVLNKLNLTLVS